MFISTTRRMRVRGSLLSGAAVAILCAPFLNAVSAYANGGAGGTGCNGAVAGGAGGSGFSGGSGSSGSSSLASCSSVNGGASGGGGGGAAGGGAGGSGGNDGLGNIGGAGGNGGQNGSSVANLTNGATLTAPTDGQDGGNGIGNNSASGGGGGGAGGYGVIVTGSGTSSNNQAITGGKGGAGGIGQTSGQGGGGGDGGIGIDFTASSVVFSNSSTISGGAGGAGGNGGSGGRGGNGGVGVNFTSSSASFTNTGTVNGGAGGNGGLGGTGAGGAGGNGGDAVDFAAGTASFTNSGTVKGGKGGTGGGGSSAGASGSGGNGVFFGSDGAVANTGSVGGGDGGDAIAGGVGGNGGFGVYFTGFGTLTNTGAAATITGGNGGLGNGSVGGNGGIAVYLANGGTVTNSGTIAGGNGGAGGTGGTGGTGGIALFFANGGTLNNSGTIAGGSGGTGATNGSGGVAIEGGDLTIVNSGTISGGLSGDGTTRANAIVFTGGTNTLELDSGSTINGNVVAFSAADTLRLGGATNASFDVSAIGPQYQGFGVFEKAGTSTWTLTGTTSQVTNWQINQGALAISSDSNLGAASSTLTLNGSLPGGATLRVLANVVSARNITLNSGVDMFDTNGHTLTLSGTIDGAGGLTKIGAGTLTLSGANTYSGGNFINAGTLAISADNNLGDSGNTVTFTGNATLQFLASLSTARIININTAGIFGTIDTDGNDVTLSSAIGGPGGLSKIGNGTLTLSANETYTGGTRVDGGTLVVTGSLTSSSGIVVGSGGTVTGTGTLPNLTVSNGGTVLAGPAVLHVSGNTVIAPGGTYSVGLTPSSTDAPLSISGSASLGGTINFVPSGGTFTLGQQYDVLTAVGGVNGMFQNATVTGSFGPNLTAVVTYEPNDVIATIEASAISPFLPNSASTNQRNVASAIDFAMANDGAVPVFDQLAFLSPSDLEKTLDQFSGEVTPGLQAVSRQSLTGFLSDLDSRASLNDTLGAPRYASRYDFTRLADNGSPAGLYVSPAGQARPLELWVSFRGAHNHTQANPTLGTHSTQADDFGGTVGFAYRAPSGHGVLGVALGFDNLNWNLAQNLGSGHAYAYQGGIYANALFDETYVLAAASFGTYDATTDRTLNFQGKNTYHGKLTANAEGGHVEIGQNFLTVIGHVAPYVRGEVQDLHTPFFSESTTSGSPSFALDYQKEGHIDLTSEVGGAYSANLSEAADDIFRLKFRLGWLHDYSAGFKDSATFSGFTGANFTVFGAPPAKDAAHAVVGLEQDLASFAFTVDAEVILSSKSQSVGAANAGFAYRW